jgi:hypothetical protein
MKRTFIKGVMTICMVLLLCSVGYAGKPMTGEPDYLVGIGNGFPSGPHYNLLIHGKADTFSCPPEEFYLLVTADNNVDGDLDQLVKTCDDVDVCTETDIQIFGNVINIPRVSGSDPITILMESGGKGPKSKLTTVGLEVTDWCTESFPDDGDSAPPLGDAAILRLQKDEDGYAVYGRVLGKPGDDGEPMFNMIPELKLVMDEQGHDLVLLGFVTPSGVFNPEGLPISRYDSGGKGKGAKKASNITSLFEWSGEVCYIQEDSDLYCWEDAENVCTTLPVCCVDTTLPDPDGIYDRCDLLSDVGVIPDGEIDPICPAIDNDGFAYTAIDAQCNDYENEWVFNIGDMVDVLWNVEHTGVYNVQIRFYPLPLNEGE